jgi:succinyl-diaminopimelate desuccinylase
VAYPHRAANPVPVLLRLLLRLQTHRLDEGYPQFQPSNLDITKIDVPNTATNIIPGVATARLNIRFNEKHSGKSLIAWVNKTVAQYADTFEVKGVISGESFVTQPGPMVDILRDAIVDATGVEPKLDTGGGTSDARFIANYCPVAEFGLVGATMHQTDERVPVNELRDLARIYRNIVAAFQA